MWARRPAAGHRLRLQSPAGGHLRHQPGVGRPRERGQAALCRAPGPRPELERAVATGLLKASADPAMVGTGEHVIVVVGTPVGENLEPDQAAVPNALAGCADHLADSQILILRSTVYPGVTARVEEDGRPARRRDGRGVLPRAHRRGQGHDRAVRAAADRVQPQFRRAGPGQQAVRQAHVHADVRSGRGRAGEAVHQRLALHQVRHGEPSSYMMANDRGLDFERIRQGLIMDYPRAADMPGAGCAAGPCLFKDTMQLAAFNNNNFALGHTAMTINEGLPLYLVARLEQRFNLAGMTVGILGMAFKGGSDDIRSSLV